MQRKQNSKSENTDGLDCTRLEKILHWESGKIFYFGIYFFVVTNYVRSDNILRERQMELDRSVLEKDCGNEWKYWR